MEQVPIRVTYHRQKSSTARIRGGQIHLRISNLVSRREQERHVAELTEKMMEAWGRLGDARERVSLKGVFDEVREMSEISEMSDIHGMKDSKDLKDLKEGEDEDKDEGGRLRFKVGVYPGVLRMSTGVEYKVKIKKGKNRKVKIEKIGTQLLVIQPVDQDFDVEEAEKVLWTFLAKDQVSVLEDRLNELREGWIGEEFSVLKLKQVMTRWGSCDKRRGIIMLSVKLLFMDAKLLDYVCVHELAHLRHANHSDLFWDLVSQKMPDWKIQRKRMRGFE
jgi:hypothetical protein